MFSELTIITKAENQIDERSDTGINQTELVDLKTWIMAEWLKTKETSMNECDPLSKIRNFNQNLKVIGKIRVAHKDIITANDVDIADFNVLCIRKDIIDSMWWK